MKFVDDGKIYVATYFVYFTVSPEAIKEVKQFWFNNFTFKLYGKKYYFVNFEQNVDLLRKAIAAAGG